ncbi:ATP-binding protein [Sulfuriroseicoccus oceanibius]|uniref:AAA family ATPase n=1 Tax=Sulfuriroseicoccus oceanibius TaxID=2707525 RepID=A0A6B3LAH1_9BACT|nr:ATP-binding protein [Sulfuriroseicoccus oceanibius]QQL43850.1 AAA family ATPase [Sulfuriroseicoccus oceanibius]
MSELDALRQQVAAAPRDAGLWFALGRQCLEDWALDEAQAAFESVLELEPKHVGAQLELARTLSFSGMSSAAMVRVEAVLQHDPFCVEAMLLMARIFWQDGDGESARLWLRRASTVDASVRDRALERELSETMIASDDEMDGQSPAPRPAGNGKRGRKSNEGAVDDDDDDPFGDFDAPTWEESFQMNDFERPALRFENVLGHPEVKRELGMKLVYPARNPELFRRYGKAVGGSVILYGPPGCGKTQLAKATAGEIGARFFTISPHQLLDMYVGGSERNMHHLFDLARKDAPSVIFLEDIDLLVADRFRQRGSGAGNQRGLLQQLLRELDNSDGKNNGVLIIGSSNAPWNLDLSVSRPGRFDRALYVGAPDSAQREVFIRRMVENKPCEALDTALIAKKTRDFTTSDLDALIDAALDNVLAYAMETGDERPMNTADFLDALERVKGSVPLWFSRMKQDGGTMPSGWEV